VYLQKKFRYRVAQILGKKKGPKKNNINKKKNPGTIKGGPKKRGGGKKIFSGGLPRAFGRGWEKVFYLARGLFFPVAIFSRRRGRAGLGHQTGFCFPKKAGGGGETVRARLSFSRGRRGGGGGGGGGNQGPGAGSVRGGKKGQGGGNQTNGEECSPGAQIFNKKKKNPRESAPGPQKRLLFWGWACFTRGGRAREGGVLRHGYFPGCVGRAPLTFPGPNRGGGGGHGAKRGAPPQGFEKPKIIVTTGGGPMWKFLAVFFFLCLNPMENEKN